MQQQPRQQPQQQLTSQRGPTLVEMIGPMGRGLLGIGRDIWRVGIVQGMRDLRTYLAHPTYPFFITLAVIAWLALVLALLSVTGAVASQADYLRHLMDQLP